MNDQIRLFEEVLKESKIQEDVIITSVEECKEALETIAGFLQDLNIAIEENYVAEMLDSFPKNPLRESNLLPKEVPNVESYSKSAVGISKGFGIHLQAVISIFIYCNFHFEMLKKRYLENKKRKFMYTGKIWSLFVLGLVDKE